MADTSNIDAQIAAAEQEEIALNNQMAQASQAAGNSASGLDRLIAGIPMAGLLQKKAELSKRIQALKAQKQEQENLAAAQGANIGPDQWANFYSQQAFGGSNINLPGMQLGNQDQARNEQARVIQALQAQARGDMNSLGQQQLAQGFQQAGAQQRSLGSSIRGTGGGAGLRAGAMGAADTRRGLAGQQEMLKLQEQQAAQAMLAQLLAQQQAQDVGLAGSMASGSLANQQLNQEIERFYGSGLTENVLSNYQRQSDLARAQLGFDLGARDLAAQQRNQFMQMGAAAAGTASNMFGDSEKPARSRYRQVDGQDSIVPIDDK